MSFRLDSFDYLKDACTVGAYLSRQSKPPVLVHVPLPGCQKLSDCEDLS
jgi:hypothetical protein